MCITLTPLNVLYNIVGLFVCLVCICHFTGNKIISINVYITLTPLNVLYNLFVCLVCICVTGNKIISINCVYNSNTFKCII